MVMVVNPHVVVERCGWCGKLAPRDDGGVEIRRVVEEPHHWWEGLGGKSW